MTPPLERYNLTPMDPAEISREIARTTPAPSKPRAAYGRWLTPAWTVRGLVEAGWTVSDAVRKVIHQLSLHPPDIAFRSIRACYYVIREREWPVSGDVGEPEDYLR